VQDEVLKMLVPKTMMRAYLAVRRAEGTSVSLSDDARRRVARKAEMPVDDATQSVLVQ
jgi:hypothetical protein